MHTWRSTTASIALTALGALFLDPTGLSASLITIETAPIDDAGNVADTQPQGDFGAVNYPYRLGRTEVTNTQYAAFLNAVAATDPNGLYTPLMGSQPPGGIVRSGTDGHYSYHVKRIIGGTGTEYDNKPVVYVNRYDAMRFVNWLENGQPSGPQDASTTEDGAYTFSGLTTVGERNAGASVVLPNEDEWYKAAYYKGGSLNAGYWHFPTRSDVAPNNNMPTADTGNSANFFDGDFTMGGPGMPDLPYSDSGAYLLSTGAYNTFDMAGNVMEWTETTDGALAITRGGAFDTQPASLSSTFRPQVSPLNENLSVGFRIAFLPKPSTGSLPEGD